MKTAYKYLQKLLILLLFFSCISTYKKETLVRSQNWSDKEIVEYCKGEYTLSDSTSLQITSTSAKYYVFKAKNLNTREIKEICCEYNFLEGAINIDSLNYKLDKKNKIHCFKNLKSLQNIGFFEFDKSLVNTCIKESSIETILKQYNKNPDLFNQKIKSECQLYYTYFLFKNGIMSKRSSLIASLIIMTNNELDKEEKEIKKILDKYNSNIQADN